MSGGISAATVISLAGAAATAYGAYESSKVKMPQMPAPQAPPAAAQSGKQADRTAAVAGNAAAAMPGGAMAGSSSTFLTGPTGINPSSLSLGKNILLGQ